MIFNRLKQSETIIKEMNINAIKKGSEARTLPLWSCSYFPKWTVPIQLQPVELLSLDGGW